MMNALRSRGEQPAPGLQYPYKPDPNAAILSNVLFAIAGIAFIAQVVRYKTWFMAPMVFGILLEEVGIIFHAVSISHELNVPFFLTAHLTVILAPAFFIIQMHLVLDRLIQFVTPIERRTRWSLWTPVVSMTTFMFVLGESLILLQLFGAAIMVSHEYPKGIAGDDVNVMMRAQEYMGGAFGGEALNLLGFFLWGAHWLIACRAWRRGWIQTTAGQNWFRKGMTVLVAAVLLMVRDAFRIIEFLSLTININSKLAIYLSTHEWTGWVFDITPVFLVVLIFTIEHPGAYLPQFYTTLIYHPDVSQRDSVASMKGLLGPEPNVLPPIPEKQTYYGRETPDTKMFAKVVTQEDTVAPKRYDAAAAAAANAVAAPAAPAAAADNGPKFKTYSQIFGVPTEAAVRFDHEVEAAKETPTFKTYSQIFNMAPEGDARFDSAFEAARPAPGKAQTFSQVFALAMEAQEAAYGYNPAMETPRQQSPAHSPSHSMAQSVQKTTFSQILSAPAGMRDSRRTSAHQSKYTDMHTPAYSNYNPSRNSGVSLLNMPAFNPTARNSGVSVYNPTARQSMLSGAAPLTPVLVETPATPEALSPESERDGKSWPLPPKRLTTPRPLTTHPPSMMPFEDVVDRRSQFM